MTEFGKKPDVTFPYDMGPGQNVKDIDAIVNQISSPSMGTTMPTGKINSSEDALGYKSNYKGQTSFEAKEDPNRAKQALDRQLNRGTATGGPLGDATTRQQSGTNFKEGME